MQKENLTFREWFLINEISRDEADRWATFEKNIKKDPENMRFSHIFGDKDRIVIPYGKDNDILKQIEKAENVKIDWPNKKVTQKTVTQQGEKDQVIKLGRFLQNLINKNPDNQEYKQLLRIFETGQEAPQADKLPESVIISRKPIDIVRMSDFEGSSSCHSPNRSYWKSAQSEAETGGVVSYLVNTKDLEGVDLEADEIFEDKCRGRKGIKPIERIRLRSFTINDKKILVPETKVYLRAKQGSHTNDKFYNLMRSWALKNNEDVGEFDGDLYNVTLHGGVSDSRSEDILSKYFNIRQESLHGRVQGDNEDEMFAGADDRGYIGTLQSRIMSNWEDHGFDDRFRLEIVPSRTNSNEFVNELIATFSHCFPQNSFKLLLPIERFPLDEDANNTQEDADLIDDISSDLSRMLNLREMDKHSKFSWRVKLFIGNNSSLCIEIRIQKGSYGDYTADLQEAERFFDAIDVINNIVDEVPNLILKTLENSEVIESKSLLQQSADLKVRHASAQQAQYSHVMRGGYVDKDYIIEVPPIYMGDLSGLKIGKNFQVSISDIEHIFYRSISFTKDALMMKLFIIMDEYLEDKLEEVKNDKINFPDFHFDIEIRIDNFAKNEQLISDFVKNYKVDKNAIMPDIKLFAELVVILHGKTIRNESFNMKRAFQSLEKFIKSVKLELPQMYSRLKQKALTAG